MGKDDGCLMNIKCLKLAGYIDKGSKLVASEGIHINVPWQSLERDHYLGMSAMAGCINEAWIAYHTPEFYAKYDDEISPKLQRIFRLGHILEEEVLTYIEFGGGKLTHLQSEVTDFNRCFRGHCDGVLDDKFVLEIKGLNDEYSGRLIGLGALAGFFGYYVQIQLYMHYLKLLEGFIVDYNKNTCDIIIEHIPYDEPVALTHVAKAEKIINTKHIRDLGDNPYDEEGCIFCSAIDICSAL